MESARRKDFKEVISVIALPNPVSIQFHKKAGFHEIGVMKGIGFKFGKYIDVAFLQKSLCMTFSASDPYAFD